MSSTAGSAANWAVASVGCKAALQKLKSSYTSAETAVKPRPQARGKISKISGKIRLLVEPLPWSIAHRLAELHTMVDHKSVLFPSRKTLIISK